MGCAPHKTDSAGFVFFPPPPETPRVQFLCAISKEADLDRIAGRRSRFLDFLLGPPDERKGIVKPYGVALRELRFYVCDSMARTVWVMDLLTGAQTRLRGDDAQGKLRKPINICIDEAGYKYVADSEREQVVVFGPDDRFVAAHGAKGQCEPVDVLAAGDRLYVVDSRDGEVEIWNKSDGRVVGRFGSRGGKPGELFFPTNIARDAGGNLYVADTGNFRVQKFGLDGLFLAAYGSAGRAFGQFALPKGIAIDPAGRVYVADARFENVQIFDPDFRLLLFIGGHGQSPGTLSLPAKIVIDRSHVEFFRRFAAPGFELEHLILVTSQYGGAKVNVFGFGHSAGAIGASDRPNGTSGTEGTNGTSETDETNGTDGTVDSHESHASHLSHMPLSSHEPSGSSGSTPDF